MYRIFFKISHESVFDTVDYLDAYFDTVSCFEDETSGDSNILDENEFPIANLFDVEVIVLDKTQFHLVEFLLDEIKAPCQNLSIEEIQNQDWLDLCYKNFEPIIVKSFFIHSSYAPENVPENHTGLLIDAATAFGSGEHQTTRGCLMAIEETLKDRPEIKTILDMGCGSGILGIACALKAPHVNVLGVDIDDKAVVVANNNAILNKVENFKAIESSGFDHVKEDLSFDLIVANILARPLISMADFMWKHANEGATIILSGLLSRQEESVIKAYQAAGFIYVHSFDIDDWIACVLKKPKE